MYRIAIVDDQARERKTLQAQIESYAKEKEIEIETVLFKDGVEFLTNYRPIYDIIFMDIDMPLIDGMKISKKLRAIDPVVSLVFVTNLAQFAIDGYSVDATDFLIKPVYTAAFFRVMDKTLRKCDRARDEGIFLRSTGGESKRVGKSSIYYVEVISHHLIYHTEEGDFPLYGNLCDVEKELGEGFERCNNCYLVNLKHVRSITGDEVVVGSYRLKISRPRKKAFLTALAHSIGDM